MLREFETNKSVNNDEKVESIRGALVMSHFSKFKPVEIMDEKSLDESHGDHSANQTIKQYHMHL